MERVSRQKHCHLALRAGIVAQHLGGLSNGSIARSLDVSVSLFVIGFYVTEQVSESLHCFRQELFRSG